MAVLTPETPTVPLSAPRHALAPRRRSRTAVLVAAAIGFAGAFVVAYLLFVRTEAGQRAEDRVGVLAERADGCFCDNDLPGSPGPQSARL
ncbi:hypothetical protein ABT261_47600, partial [Amycolatopsis sp. NPDC000740]